MHYKFNIKNVIVCALTVILLISCMAVKPAYAADNVNIKVGDITTSADGTYSVPIIIENNTGLAGVIFKVNYDTTVLKLVKTETSKDIFTTSIINKATVGSVTYVYAEAGNTTGNGTLFTLQFKSVAKSATTTDITITNIDLCDSDLKTVTGQAVNNSISVAAGSAGSSDSESGETVPDNNSTETGNNNSAGNTNNDSNTTTSGNNSGNSNSDNANPEAATNAIPQEDAPSESTTDNGENGDNITTWIIGGVIIAMCAVCAVMGVMVYKKSK